MSRIAYYRVSTNEQSIEAQRTALAGSGTFDREFKDEGVSGAVLAANRTGFSDLLKYVDPGDTVCVYSVDRLGRDAIDVQSTVRDLIDKGVTVDVKGLGPIAGDAGKIILAVLSQVADMERRKIIERTQAGRETARQHLALHGTTHKGKASLGRPVGIVGKPKEGRTVDPQAIADWRKADKSRSIAATAEHFKVSLSTVKRYCVA